MLHAKAMRVLNFLFYFIATLYTVHLSQSVHICYVFFLFQIAGAGHGVR